MSILLQPYQALPFSTSLDFQTRYKENCDNCSFENIIALNTFIPFAIISPDYLISDPVLFGCDNEKIQDLSMSFTTTLNEDTGLWFHYYDGTDLGLSCGTYYITVLVGDFIWYSEMFTIKDIATTTYPELVKDDFHLPLRIYDNITKQLANKCDMDCSVAPLNPVSAIMPFMFYTPLDICSLNVFLVNVCTLEETDLTADLELEFIKQYLGTPIYENVVSTSQLIRNETYLFQQTNYIFQEFIVQDDGLLYSITFEWSPLNDLQVLLIAGTNPNDVALASFSISPVSSEITLDLVPWNINVNKGDVFLIKIYANENVCYSGVSVSSTKLYPNGRFGECNFIGLYKLEIDCNDAGDYRTANYNYATFSCALPPSCYGVLDLPATPSTYSLKYTASEGQNINIQTSAFIFHLSGSAGNPVTAVFKIFYNLVELYSYEVTSETNDDFNVPGQNIDKELLINDEITIVCYIFSNNPIAQNIGIIGVNLRVYYYGSIVDDVYYPTGYIPLGITYQNKSLWFDCVVRKSTYTCGTGTTKVYNPGRVLPAPLICGNYYLKMTNGANEWFSEWFKIVNVGFVELTTYLLGTESDEIISGDDDVYIEI